MQSKTDLNPQQAIVTGKQGHHFAQTVFRLIGQCFDPYLLLGLVLHWQLF